MTIKEFKSKYYDQERIYELEVDALYSFVSEHCNTPRNRIAIINCLTRNGIISIDAFRDVTIDKIKSIRGIGKTRMPIIIKLKEIVDSLD